MTDSLPEGLNRPEKEILIHIFDPETDYALASGSRFYNPPASVRRLRSRLALTPLRYASPGDALLLPDDPAPDGADPFPEVQAGINLLHPSGLPDFLISCFRHGVTPSFRPWGWNPSLKLSLSRMMAGLDPRICPSLPSDDWLDSLRRLAHRRTTIPFNRMMGVADLPCEVFSVEEGIDLLISRRKGGGELFLKAPWSSSGRGVLFTGGLSPEKVGEWIGGSVRRQGSVMAETAFQKLLDCASEWELSEGEASFVGWSVFSASGSGRYAGNELLPQSELRDMISAAAPAADLDDMVRRQKNALEALVAPDYDGPLGIDMLVDSSGLLHPCIELNLRLTMGRVALEEMRLRTS